MKAAQILIQRTFDRIDNSLKILGLILASVMLTGFAIYLSSNFVRQVQHNQLNEAAQNYTQLLRQRLLSQEEQLLQYAASSPENVLRTFHDRAQRIMEKNPSFIRIEIRNEAAKLLARHDSSVSKGVWPASGNDQLPPAVMLNFLRATEQQKLYWAHGYSGDDVHTAEAIVPTRVAKYVWIVRVNTDDWLAHASNIDLPKGIQVTINEKPIADLDPNVFISMPLGIAGTSTHLLFSRRASAAKRSTLEFLDFDEIDGLNIFLAVLGASLCLLLISYARDTQRHRRARELIAKQEAALLKQNQLSVMAEISTTLAHELNQPLATITNYVAACEMLLKARNEQDPQLEAALESARKEALRAGEIVQSIRSHLKRENQITSVVSLSAFIDKLIPIIEMLVKEQKTKLQYVCAVNLFVQIDPTLLELVVVNLCKNALDAMRELPTKQRSISIEISATSTKDSRQWAQISVRDEGLGVSEEVGKKLFTSFYTTKSEGMGVGLNLCRSVAESYGGRIEWRNNPARGSTFKLILPQYRSDNTDHVNQPQPSQHQPSPYSVGGG